VIGRIPPSFFDRAINLPPSIDDGVHVFVEGASQQGIDPIHQGLLQAVICGSSYEICNKLLLLLFFSPPAQSL